MGMTLLLSPLSWLLLSMFVLIAARLVDSGGRKLLWTCTSVVLFCMLAMTPLFANLLVDWLETVPPQPTFCQTDPPRVAVVLTGGVDRWPRNDNDFAAIGIVSRRRAEKAIDWWRGKPGRQLVFAGGTRARGRTPEGVLVANYAHQLGIDAASIREETESLNTWENARNLAVMKPALPRRVVLVTSAMHMRRARYSMLQAGFEVCTLGADWRHAPFRRLSYLLPQTSSLATTESAIHELIGLVFYRLHAFRGRDTAAAVPRPGE